MPSAKNISITIAVTTTVGEGVKTTVGATGNNMNDIIRALRAVDMDVVSSAQGYETVTVTLREVPQEG